MTEKEFTPFLGIILLPPTIQLIADSLKITPYQATEQFYNSKVYALLEKEETKFWHYSPQLLCRLFTEEIKTGSFDIPEEAA